MIEKSCVTIESCILIDENGHEKKVEWLTREALEAAHENQIYDQTWEPNLGFLTMKIMEVRNFSLKHDLIEYIWEARTSIRRV